MDELHVGPKAMCLLVHALGCWFFSEFPKYLEVCLLSHSY